MERRNCYVGAGFRYTSANMRTYWYERLEKALFPTDQSTFGFYNKESGVLVAHSVELCIIGYPLYSVTFKSRSSVMSII